MLDTIEKSAQTLAAEASEAGKLCDWGRAAALWTELCILQPHHVGGRVQMISCLAGAGRPDEAEHAARKAMDEFPDTHQIFVAWARLSDARREWSEALSRWASVFKRFPDDAGGFIGILVALRELRRFDEAEAILALHVSRFQASFHVAAAAGRLAMSAKNWPLAEIRWKALRDDWPKSVDGYVGGAGAMRVLRRYGEAELLLREAIEKFGRLPDLLINMANILEERKDWEAASKYWQEAASGMPDKPAALLGQVRSLARTGRGQEADALLARLADRFPESADVVLIQGTRSEERRDWPCALACWERATVLDPTRPFFLARKAGALGRLNRHQEAEELVGQALSREPVSIDLLCSAATLAQARGDWVEAKKMWQRLLDIDPSHHVAVSHMSIVNYQLAGIETDRSSETAASKAEAKQVSEPATIQSNAEISTYEMFMQMHSLGDNCEFGMVQRKFGAEPLGLFRWTAMDIEILSEALDDNLEGIGIPDNTILELGGDEYQLSDTRYFKRMHTFIRSSEENNPDRLRLTLCKRLRYLRRELLGDLREGRQWLYVYKSKLGYNPGAIERLCGSLQRLGPNTLLCIKLADQDHPEGTAEMIDSTLIVGYISHFAPEQDWPNTAYASWKKMCERAFALWREIVASAQGTCGKSNTN